MPGQYDASGVDLSLIRANMRVTPTERARRAEFRRLDESAEQSPLERFCALLADHGVELIVVGGQAEALMGSALATALATLDLTLRGAPPDLKFRLDAAALALGQNYTFEVDGTFDELLPRTDVVSIGGRPTHVIGLDDLIRIKRYIGRPKDRESLLHLEAIKRLREQEGLR
jgi:hypothetical protein